MVKKRQKRLIFDIHLSYGSKEHFFHFMWGYLLPAFSFIHEQQDRLETTYYFDSCGPAMDQITLEMINLLSIDARILSKEKMEFIEDQKTMPRWDVYLLRDYILDPGKTYSIHIAKFQNDSTLTEYLKTPGFYQKFKTQILDIKEIIERKVINHQNSESTRQNHPLLILRRSEAPPYYLNEGEAEIKGYGTSRRGLTDIDDFVKVQQEKGTNIIAYEPGKHSLKDQIITLHNARGIIGIKGAEFANLVWLRENTQVIQIRPNSMNTPNVQEKLANLLNLNFREIITAEGNHPSMMKLNLRLE